MNAVRHLAVLLLLSSGCLAPVDEAPGAQASASSVSPSTAVAPQVQLPACGGARVDVTDPTVARARLQGRWRRCAEPRGNLAEAPRFVRDVAAFEVVGDEWFALQQGADGRWQRQDDLDHSGRLQWWSMGNVGVAFELGGTAWLPAVLAFTTGSVRLDVYPGVQVDYAPLP